MAEEGGESSRLGRCRNAGSIDDLSMSGSRQAPPWIYLEL